MTMQEPIVITHQPLPKTTLWACPVCSVVRLCQRVRETLHQDILCQPYWSHGQRTGLLFFIPSCGCYDTLGGFTTAAAEKVAERWNNRCEQEAVIKADRMKLTDQRQTWLHCLSTCTPWPSDN